MKRTFLLLAMTLVALNANANGTQSDPTCRVLKEELRAVEATQLSLIEKRRQAAAQDWQAIDQYLAYGRKRISGLLIESNQSGCSSNGESKS